MKTSYTELVGATLPLELAPMGGIAVPPLMTAIAREGGVGMMGAQMIPAGALVGMLESLPKDVPGAYGAGLVMPFLDRAAIPVIAKRVRIVSFFYGDPDAALIDEVHQYGALAEWQVGSVSEAVAAQEAGADIIVVQGVEAGSRLRGETPLAELLPAVLREVTVPVVAAGGIGTREDAAWAIRLGAAAVRSGTRFAAAEESNAHPVFQQKLVEATADETVVTTKFSVMWPAEEPARVLRSALDAAEATTDAIVGKAITPGGPMDLPRFAIVAPGKTASGNVEAMALYAGRSVGAVRRIQPAAEIVQDLVGGLEAVVNGQAAVATA